MIDDGERVLFDNGGVKVTQYRFVVDDTVYAMQNITSIRHDINQPPTPEDKFYFFVVLVGASICLLGYLLLSPSVVVGVLFLVAGLALLAYAYMCWQHNDLLPEIIRHIPPSAPPATHTVILTSAAQEESAFSTEDEDFVSEVLTALNRAIVLKG